MTYSDSLELAPEDCTACYCCTVCYEKCRCQEGLDSPVGIFNILQREIPSDMSVVQDFIKVKIREEKDEDSQSDSDAVDSLEETENVSVHSDDDAM